MKNKIVTLLTVTMLAGAMLVGCGGSETGANNGSDTDANTEVSVDSGVETVDNGLIGKEGVDLSIYTEFETGYGLTDEANYDDALVDGEELQNFNWDYVNKNIKLTKTVDYYSHEKHYSGFLKSGATVVYSQTNDEWSTVVIDIQGQQGMAFVRTDELTEHTHIQLMKSLLL